MEHRTEIKDQDERNHRRLLGVYLQMIALVMLFLSIGYWSKVVGIADPAISFETMSVPWQTSVAALVILQPVAALGLWGNARWGIVVWALVILIELTMYGLYPTIFGEADRLVLFHLISFATYLMTVLLFAFLDARRVLDPD